MAIIVNPRGTAGSGKTELARRIMLAYGWAGPGSGAAAEPILRSGRSRPLGYRLRHPRHQTHLVVLGHYERRCGGCDTIRLEDGGLAEVFRLADLYASDGHDVLIEGRALSSEWQRSAVLAQSHPLHVLALATPPEAAAWNLARRRRAARRSVPGLEQESRLEQQRVAAACERLRQHAVVRRMGLSDALEYARDLLRLEGGGSAGPERGLLLPEV